MNERPRVRFWIGFAAVAAIGLLTMGGWLYNRSGVRSAPKTNHGDDAPLEDQRAVATRGHPAAAPSKNGVEGRPTAEQPSTREQEEARALTSKRYKAAQFSPHRLEWEPEENHPSTMVYDLCDDVQASEAGLHDNALEEQRQAYGIDCKKSNAHRFGFIPAPDEAMRFADSYEEANALLKEFAETRSIKGEKFDEPIRMLLGHRGSWPVDIGLALDPCGTGFGCAAATFNVSGGATLGLFSNVSKEVAHDVTIRAGNVVAHHPLSVQPGESTAFVLPAELSEAELATLTITATFVGKADPRRGVLLLGAPGDITGPRSELASRFFGIPPTGPDEVTYFSEQIMLEKSTNHPEAAQSLPSGALDAPVAVVALLDPKLKVVAVLHPAVTSDESGKPMPVTAMVPVKNYAIGFVMPPAAGQSFISIGGAE